MAPEVNAGRPGAKDEARRNGRALGAAAPSSSWFMPTTPSEIRPGGFVGRAEPVEPAEE
jgi:hypothetical protein